MYVTLGSIETIPAEEGRSFQVGKLSLALFRGRDGSVYATEAQCPHHGGGLADGLGASE